MPNTLEGKLNAQGLRFGIVVSRFNEFITGRLRVGSHRLAHPPWRGREQHHRRLGARDLRDPNRGPEVRGSGRFDAVVCLGALIRGATPHFDYLAAEVTKGIAQIGLQTGVPTVFGVITTDNIEQAVERAGTKSGNKGFDAATTAIEMANILRQIA